MWSVHHVLFVRPEVDSDFRGARIPILAVYRLLLPRFSRIVTKILIELKLMR